MLLWDSEAAWDTSRPYKTERVKTRFFKTHEMIRLKHFMKYVKLLEYANDFNQNESGNAHSCHALKHISSLDSKSSLSWDFSRSWDEIKMCRPQYITATGVPQMAPGGGRVGKLFVVICSAVTSVTFAFLHVQWTLNQKLQTLNEKPCTYIERKNKDASEQVNWFSEPPISSQCYWSSCAMSSCLRNLSWCTVNFGKTEMKWVWSYI